MRLICAILVASLGLCCVLGSQCAGQAALSPAVNCFTSFWDDDFRGGFSPPSNLEGPVLDFENDMAGVSGKGLSWHLPGTDLGAFNFSAESHPGTTLEDEVSFAAQAASVHNTIFRNEAVTVHSGESAWVIAWRDQQYPDDIMGVEVQLVRDGGTASARSFSVTGFGTTLHGTYDYDYLLSVCLSLCAE